MLTVFLARAGHAADRRGVHSAATFTYVHIRILEQKVRFHSIFKGDADKLQQTINDIKNHHEMFMNLEKNFT